MAGVFAWNFADNRGVVERLLGIQFFPDVCFLDKLPVQIHAMDVADCAHGDLREFFRHIVPGMECLTARSSCGFAI